jgi:hypothetical protein
VIPPFEQIDGGRRRSVRQVVRIAHYFMSTGKTRIRLVISVAYCLTEGCCFQWSLGNCSRRTTP